MANAFTDTAKNAMLDSVAGTPAWPPTHVSLHTDYPGGTGANEATGGSPAYARKATAWSAAAAGAKAGSNTPVFDVPAGTYKWLGYWSAITAGTYWACSPLGGGARRAVSMDAGDLAGDLLQSPTHGLTTDNQVVFWAGLGAALPTGLVEGTIYFVIATGLTADAFKVSATQGGAAIDITAIGDGEVQRIIPETYGGQGTLTVNSYSLSLPG